MGSSVCWILAALRTPRGEQMTPRTRFITLWVPALVCCSLLYDGRLGRTSLDINAGGACHMPPSPATPAGQTPNSSATLEHLTAHNPDIIWHVGDLSYAGESLRAVGSVCGPFVPGVEMAGAL